MGSTGIDFDLDPSRSLPPLPTGDTDAMYSNPAYGHHVGGGGESSTDEDFGRACGLPRAAWLSGTEGRDNAGGVGVGARAQRRRAWLRDAGVVVALVVAGLALGLSAAKEGARNCPCVTDVEAASALRTEMDTLNATLAAMRVEVAEVGRTLETVRADVTTQLGGVERRAAGLCDALYESKAITASLEVVQEVDTSIAIDWEAFMLDGATYLAVANRYDGSTWNLKSRIYRHSSVSGLFEVVQEVDTSGAFDWEAFTLDGATYLVVVKDAWNLKSRIYSINAPC